MKIALGADHAGYRYKQMLIDFLTGMGYECVDLGAATDQVPADDYHWTSAAVAEATVRGEVDRGIVICGTGIGVSIAANKVPGARCALCNDLFTARMSREHNEANVLALGSRVAGEGLAKEIVRTWLETDFSGGRFIARNTNVARIEEKYKRSEG
ncbi:MAG: ribose 5-phosphate isomerase B [Anaerolineae bacterium]|jgi:ribose 5-phosphate isomerase B|nr:ribose 5-phosphate isomerase B [Anaerolineae bacterium]